MWIFCCGMRRSGSTLQYQLTVRLVEEAGAGHSVSWDRPSGFPILRDQHAGEPGFKVWKSHAYTDAMGEELKEGRARGVHAYRDLRDVTVSAMRKWKRSFDELWEAGFLDQDLRRMRLWTAHPEVLVSRYEDLVADLPGEVARIAAHLGLTIDAADCRRIAEDHGLERQQDRIAKARQDGVLEKGLHQDSFDPQSMLHTNHIQSGQHGAWKEVLRPGQVACIESRYGDWLSAHGYQLELGPVRRLFCRWSYLLAPGRARRHVGYLLGRLFRRKPTKGGDG